jgi:hypothetical protein
MRAAAAAAVIGSRFPARIVLPEFANARDLVLCADPGGHYEKYKGQVLFANEATYREDGYSEKLTQFANTMIRQMDPTIANDSRFLETYFQEPLTNYAVGWRDPNNIEATVSMIAPPVPVGRRFEWKAAVNSEEFLSEVVDDQRAIGADFKKVIYTGTDVTDKTLNRGLTLIVDLDNVTGANWQNQKTAKLMRRLWRNRLRRAISVIDAASVNAPYTWRPDPINPGVVPVNPDQDLRNELITATNISGIRPNRVVYGDSAFNSRLGAYGAQNNPAGFTGYTPNAMDQVSAGLMVDKVIVSKERYQSAAAAKSELLGNLAYAFYAQDGVDTEDPSNIKCFVSTFDAEQGGGLVRVYVQQLTSKLVAITVEMYEKLVITYSGGIRKLTITNQ